MESLLTATVMLCAVGWGTVVEMSAAHAVKASSDTILHVSYMIATLGIQLMCSHFSWLEVIGQLFRPVHK